MQNGVYWVGSNGQVYVKGSQGTNSAGRADANTNNYWGSRGFSRINDPNPSRGTLGYNNFSGQGLNPASGFNSTGPTYRPPVRSAPPVVKAATITAAPLGFPTWGTGAGGAVTNNSNTGGGDSGPSAADIAAQAAYDAESARQAAAVAAEAKRQEDLKAQAIADNNAYLDDQTAQLKALLGRTDVGLSQGLTKNQNEYDTQLGGANNEKDLTYAGYQDQRVAQNQGKQAAQSTNLSNANQGYRSLAQIIGRSAGTGSSAFRDLLPNVVGTDLSGKQRAVNQTFGTNLQGIDKSQAQYDISFANVLADLLRQKQANEGSLRSSIESQRQGINSQLSGVAGERVINNEGRYAEVKSAQSPFQQAINNSRNAVEGFFGTYNTPYTRPQAVAPTPDIANYVTDRAAINARDQGGDPTNPYLSILRKRLQERA